MSAGAAKPSRPFWRSPTRIALVASLIVNIFLIGTAVGRYGVGDRAGPGQRGGGAIERALRSQPEDVRALARALRDERRDNFAAARSEARAARAALRETIRREPFDAEAVRAAQDRLRARASATRRVADDSLVDLLERLDPDARRAVIEALPRPRRR